MEEWRTMRGNKKCNRQSVTQRAVKLDGRSRMENGVRKKKRKKLTRSKVTKMPWLLPRRDNSGVYCGRKLA